NYEGNNGSLPSGGFGWTWFGDPSQKGMRQPGAWTFTLLPYLEQEELYSAAGSPTGARDAMVTPVSIFSCPSRLGPRVGTSMAWVVYYNFPGGPGNIPDTAFRGDYAACAGSGECEDPGPAYPLPKGWSPPYMGAKYNGATYQFSATKMLDLSHGSSNTYLYGEKYLCRDNYLDGFAGNDNEGVYVGFDNDSSRSSSWQPYRDASGFDSYYSFGSAHPGGFNMAFADGSVELLPYDIDMSVFSARGTR